MAITPEDIIEQYRADIDNYLETIEAQIDVEYTNQELRSELFWGIFRLQLQFQFQQ